MKTATVAIEAILILCPHCGEPIESRSQFWTEDEHAAANDELFCHTCGETVRKPKWPTRKQRAAVAA